MKLFGRHYDSGEPISLEIADGKASIDEHAKAAGRDPASIDITAFAPTGLFRTPAELDELGKAGADNVVLWLDGQNEQDLLAELEELAGTVLA